MARHPSSRGNRRLYHGLNSSAQEVTGPREEITSRFAGIVPDHLGIAPKPPFVDATLLENGLGNQELGTRENPIVIPEDEETSAAPGNEPTRSRVWFITMEQVVWSMSNLPATIRKIARFGPDVLLYGKGSEMANGNALVGHLVKSRAFSVVTQDSEGRPEKFVATKGVILASGGFGRSKDARAYLPHDWCVQPKGNVDDGQRMSREVGAAMPPPNPSNGVFAPVSILRTGTGQVRRYPHFSFDRTKPGSIIINTDGRRFANEAKPYQEFVQGMRKQGIEKSFRVADS
ncbi:hypothetical protein CEP54_010801 [Fusarium duplospermum]|uniref:FAD-dependent oxidoreductase 2 FAD-binding domain-containing protein n=1 Tax=Fusarium duplospermum TaxID=1325734 RepID=A0A428PI22_9HYPO|nr:hypothetical protein CEP54_010801 [Fusarium duplospermum]